jgi:hypothetical protein
MYSGDTKMQGAHVMEGASARRAHMQASTQWVNQGMNQSVDESRALVYLLPA